MVQDREYKRPHLGLKRTLRPQLEKHYSDQKADFDILIDLMFHRNTKAPLMLSGCLPLKNCFELE